jgi:hypothetical protein
LHSQTYRPDSISFRFAVVTVTNKRVLTSQNIRLKIKRGEDLKKDIEVIRRIVLANTKLKLKISRNEDLRNGIEVVRAPSEDVDLEAGRRASVAVIEIAHETVMIARNSLIDIVEIVIVSGRMAAIAMNEIGDGGVIHETVPPGIAKDPRSGQVDQRSRLGKLRGGLVFPLVMVLQRDGRAQHRSSIFSNTKPSHHNHNNSSHHHSICNSHSHTLSRCSRHHLRHSHGYHHQQCHLCHLTR